MYLHSTCLKKALRCKSARRRCCRILAARFDTGAEGNGWVAQVEGFCKTQDPDSFFKLTARAELMILLAPSAFTKRCSKKPGALQYVF